MSGCPDCQKLEFVQNVSLPIGIEIGKTREISLTQGMIAIVDDEDYERLSQHKWYAHKNKYTIYVHRREGKGPTISMHREVLGLMFGDGKRIDHWNRNGLDNRKQNLRLVTNSQNMINCRLQRHNTSGYRGVGWLSREGKWGASIHINRKKKYCGVYNDKISAAKAFDRAAIKYRGDDAVLNFPRENYL